MAKELVEIFDQIQDSLIILDSQCRCLYCNKIFRELSGISSSQAIGTPLARLLNSHEGQLDALLSIIKEVLATGTAHSEITVIYPLRVKGTPLTCMEKVFPVSEFNGEQDCVGVLFRLISEETISVADINEGIQKSEKMIAMGELMAGLSHEIKTPLGSVISNTDVILRCTKKMNQLLHKDEFQHLSDKTNNTLHKHMSLIEQSVQLNDVASRQLLHLVNSIRHFLRSADSSKTSVDLHGLLDQVLVLTHHLTKSRIQIQQHYGQIPVIEGYPGKLGQVFLNLVTNAIQAIESTGTITISTELSGLNVAVRISDTGCGISPENVERIFQKGFTTKRRGLGTGLGLAISINIINQHQGDISVESKVGEGSTFTVKLPITLPPPSQPDIE